MERVFLARNGERVFLARNEERQKIELVYTLFARVVKGGSLFYQRLSLQYTCDMWHCLDGIVTASLL